jgi:small-conductance mechanosensitive channel
VTLLVAASGGLPRFITRLEPILHFDYWEEIVWALGLAALAFLVGRVLAWGLLALLGRWSRLTATPVDDILVRQLAGPLRWLLPFVFMAVSLAGVELPAKQEAALRQTLVIAIVLTLGWFFFRIVRVLEEVLATRLTVDGAVRPEARENYTQLQGFRNIAGFLIGLVTVGLALFSLTGVREIGASMLASAGVAGIVVGFAAQRTISTVLAGIVIAVAQPIRIDDVVVVENEGGTVEEITLTYVVVRLWDLRRMVLPINYFLEKPFENWSRSSAQMLASVLLYLDYSVPVGKLREELARLLEASPHWDRQSWNLQMTDANDRVVILRAQMSATDPPAAFALRCEVRERLVTFIQQHYPSALPRGRNETIELGEPVGTPRASA